jgi:8-oxo-dGTP pyrophosphatase MutT (NUDIX family)
MYKVFVNEKLLTISAEPELSKKENRILNIQYDSPDLLLFYLEQLKLNCYHHLHLFGENPKEIFHEFCKQYRLIEAAGGIVINAEGKALVIFRKGKWDLPKGKIDEGESSEEAAVREVAEECNIQPPQIIKLLTETWHTYTLNGQQILKKTYWYKMIPVDGNEEPSPQLAEDITEVKWADPVFFPEMKNDIYPAIDNLLNLYWK